MKKTDKQRNPLFILTGLLFVILNYTNCVSEEERFCYDRECGYNPAALDYDPPVFCGECPESQRCNNGGQCVSNCSADMVLINSLKVCIDLFEASESSEESPKSVSGAAPWVSITWRNAQKACESAGKRLCSGDEWFEACEGSGEDFYSYGDDYDPEKCNGQDNSEQVALTGEMSNCEGGYSGLYDMSGNVWEWTSTCTDDWCEASGGSYASPKTDLLCESGHSYDKNTKSDQVGFRCCMD